jgi:hypothetical protein
MKREGSRAVLVLNHRMFFEERANLASLASDNGIAVSTPYLPNAAAGALIAHEPDFDQVWRIHARYVGEILKGANPADLPVQQLAAARYEPPHRKGTRSDDPGVDLEEGDGGDSRFRQRSPPKEGLTALINRRVPSTGLLGRQGRPVVRARTLPQSCADLARLIPA